METLEKVKEDWGGGDDGMFVYEILKEKSHQFDRSFNKDQPTNKQIERSRATYFTQKQIQYFDKINPKVQGKTAQP